jgi:hypothetical protein
VLQQVAAAGRLAPHGRRELVHELGTSLSHTHNAPP